MDQLASDGLDCTTCVADCFVVLGAVVDVLSGLALDAYDFHGFAYVGVYDEAA